jgi:hypothetical protein
MKSSFFKSLVFMSLVFGYWGNSTCAWIKLNSPQESLLNANLRDRPFRSGQEICDMAVMKTVGDSDYYLRIVFKIDDKFFVNEFDIEFGRVQASSKKLNREIKASDDDFASANSSKYRIPVCGSGNFMAEVIGDKMYLYHYVQGEYSVLLSGTNHNKHIEQLRFSAAKDGLNDIVALATSSQWPTLKLYQRVPAPPSNAVPNVSQDSYLLGFERGTLVYGKIIPQDLGLWNNFWRRLGFFGKKHVNVNILYNFDISQPISEAGSSNSAIELTVNPANYPLVSATGTMVVLFDPSAYSLHIHHKNVSQLRIEVGLAQTIKNGDHLQRIHLINDQKLLMVTDKTIFIDTQVETRRSDDKFDPVPIINFSATDKIHNIVASCVNGDMLFVLHEDQNGQRAIYRTDMTNWR